MKNKTAKRKRHELAKNYHKNECAILLSLLSSIGCIFLQKSSKKSQQTKENHVLVVTRALALSGKHESHTKNWFFSHFFLRKKPIFLVWLHDFTISHKNLQTQHNKQYIMRSNNTCWSTSTREKTTEKTETLLQCILGHKNDFETILTSLLEYLIFNQSYSLQPIFRGWKK